MLSARAFVGWYNGLPMHKNVISLFAVTHFWLRSLFICLYSILSTRSFRAETVVKHLRKVSEHCQKAFVFISVSWVLKCLVLQNSPFSSIEHRLFQLVRKRKLLHVLIYLNAVLVEIVNMVHIFMVPSRSLMRQKTDGTS